MTELRHPGDSRDLRPIGGPPRHGAVTRVRDILLVTIGMWVHEIDSDELLRLHREHPPVTEAGAFDLGRGLRLEKLDHRQGELLMNACEPRGHFFFGARQFGHRYAYVYEPSKDAAEQSRYSWDPEKRILTAMHLSRLVR